MRCFPELSDDACITSGSNPSPPLSMCSKNCRRMRGSQNLLIWVATPSARMSSGCERKNVAIWLAMRMSFSRV